MRDHPWSSTTSWFVSALERHSGSLLPNREVKQREIPGPPGQLPPNPVSQISFNFSGDFWPSRVALLHGIAGRSVPLVDINPLLRPASATSPWQPVRSG